MRVLGSAVGLLAVASGCTTTAGGTAESRFVPSQQVTRLSRVQQVAWRDSVYAQAIADAEGPGANIRAELSSMAGSRRLRAVFDLENDAYVLIGHIDADGVLRVVFPNDPVTDDGFVRGKKTYRTNEFFAGFNDQYRMRAQRQYGSFFAGGMRRPDSYDGGFGYLFVIASWRPMNFDRFRSEGEWDSFELTDASYLSDPRPAIYELASLLVGENREAYTVKFARYTNTRNQYGEFAYTGGSSAFSNYGMCSGFGLMGFPFNPFDEFGFGFAGIGGFGFNSYSFTRRGINYYYDSFSGCYRRGGSSFGFGTGYRIAGYQPTNLPKRPLDPEIQRSPFTPRLVAEHAMPGGRVPESSATHEVPRVSPAYRERGLITTEEPGTMPERRAPRGESRVGAEQRSRPALQDMVSRRAATNTEQGRANNGWRAQNGVGSSNGGSSRAGYASPVDREQRERRLNDYQGESRNGSQSRERYAAPSDAGSRGGGSSAGASSPPTRSAPPPSAAPPASAPPASQGSGPATSTAGRPGTP
jgi:hypothetical protein